MFYAPISGNIKLKTRLEKFFHYCFLKVTVDRNVLVPSFYYNIIFLKTFVNLRNPKEHRAFVKYAFKKNVVKIYYGHPSPKQPSEE